MEITQITFLRFVAAMGVVVFHFGRDAPSLAWGTPLWEIGNTAVSFFFVLSGYILTIVYGQRGIRSARDFYVARAARILPVYWLALLAMTLWAFTQKKLDALDWLLSVLAVQAWWPGHSQALNTPGWTLSVELLFYLSFPFILPRVQRITRGRTLLWLMFAVWAANSAAHVVLVDATQGRQGALRDFVAYHPLTHLATFVFGVAGGLLFLRERDWFARRGLLLMALSMGAFLIGVWSSAGILRYHHNGLFAPVFFAFIAGLSGITGHPIARALSARPLVLLGDVSYSIYILQVPISLLLFSLQDKTNIELNADEIFWVRALLIVACSYLTYRFFEVPMRSRVKTWADGWKAKTPAA